MLTTVRRAVAVLIVATACFVSAVVFLLAAPITAGGQFKEPIGTACVDPWVESHPGDFEPDVSGSWSWWPPGLTCAHSSGEEFVSPSMGNAVAVGLLGLTVTVVGVGPAVLVAAAVWPRSRAARDRARHGPAE